MAHSNWIKEWLRNNGEKLKTAYSYAVVNKLDIKSKEDVLKILHAIDPKNAAQEQAEKYSKILQLFGSRFRKTAREVLEK